MYMAEIGKGLPIKKEKIVHDSRKWTNGASRLLKKKGDFTGKLRKLCWWRDGEQSFGGKSMLSLFYFQALEKLDFDVLNFWLLTKFSI